MLNDGLIKQFLELLERKFQDERRYAFKHGIHPRDGMSMYQEISIDKITVQKL